ncbi:MAG: type III pantothenate kinase [Elusimicrobia bacterium]|nr:type III pantothenate kinase [Elusimicrobiota bacterium]
MIDKNLNQAFLNSSSSECLILIDIGNTSTRLGYSEGDCILWTVDIPTQPIETLHERYLKENIFGDVAEKISGGVIATVVPDSEKKISSILTNSGIPLLHVNHKITGGVKLGVKNPAALGADRIANAAAVVRYYKKSAIVADLGTANTFDVVNANGLFLGGLIAPGGGAISDALSSRAAKLDKVDLIFPEKIIGDDTESALKSGLYFSVKGQIDEIFAAILSELKENHLKIITGGVSEIFRREFPGDYVFDRNLTLKGLIAIWMYKTESS